MKHAAVIAPALLLAGCIPIVMSEGYVWQSRQNVPDVVPAFIEAGRTTMADVILALGEPDTVAVDEGWIVYLSRYRESGGGAVLLVGAGYSGGALGGTSESMLLRRLIVRFDEAGTVADATLDITRCVDTTFIFGQTATAAPPCFDVHSRDLVIRDLTQRLAAAGETNVIVHDHAEWLPTRERGLLAVSDTAVHFVVQGGPGAGLRLAFKDIERTELRQKLFALGQAGRPQVVLLRGEEVLGSFVLLADLGDDELRTRAVSKLVSQRLAAAHH